MMKDLEVLKNFVTHKLESDTEHAELGSTVTNAFGSDIEKFYAEIITTIEKSVSEDKGYPLGLSMDIKVTIPYTKGKADVLNIPIDIFGSQQDDWRKLVTYANDIGLPSLLIHKFDCRKSEIELIYYFSKCKTGFNYSNNYGNIKRQLSKYKNEFTRVKINSNNLRSNTSAYKIFKSLHRKNLIKKVSLDGKTIPHMNSKKSGYYILNPLIFGSD